MLKGVVGAVGGLLSGLLGGYRPKPQLPKQVLHQYQPHCGVSLPSAGGKTCSATGYLECLNQCERDAIQLTVAVGDLHDCLGATIDDGIEVDNCLYLLGSNTDIADLEARLPTDSQNVGKKSFVLLPAAASCESVDCSKMGDGRDARFLLLCY